MSSCLENIKRKDSLAWKGLSVIFAFLAIDEYKEIHGRLSSYVVNLLNNISWIDVTSGAGQWVYAYSLLLLIFLSIYYSFWLRLSRETRHLLLASFVIFVFGSLGIEFLTFQVLKIWKDSHLYTLLYTFEELLEMIGIALFNFAVLKHILRDSLVMIVRQDFSGTSHHNINAN